MLNKTLNKSKIRRTTVLISISAVILLFSGFCYSQSNQPEESNNHQAIVNTPVKKTFSFLSQQKEAASGKKELAEPMDALTVSLGLMFILLLIFLLAWVMRKVGYGQFSGQGALSILATLNLGQKEKITLIKVGQQQILIGITASQINTLYVLDDPLDIESLDKDSQATTEKNHFAKKLNEVLNPPSSRVKES